MKILFLLFLFTFQVSAQEIKLNEAYYVNTHCTGKIEFVLPDKTRVDCLTNTHAVEYDYGKK